MSLVELLPILNVDYSYIEKAVTYITRSRRGGGGAHKYMYLNGQVIAEYVQFVCVCVCACMIVCLVCIVHAYICVYISIYVFCSFVCVCVSCYLSAWLLVKRFCHIFTLSSLLLPACDLPWTFFGFLCVPGLLLHLLLCFLWFVSLSMYNLCL